MNEALKKELEFIYWREDKEENPKYEACCDAFYKIYDQCKDILSPDSLDQLEDSFLSASTLFGLSQFLWGYEYALKMMNKY